MVDAPAGGERGVALLVARIAIEILERAELRWVDEDAGHDDVALLACAADQRLVSRVQRPHRRHEPDPRARATRLERRSELEDRPADDHRAATAALIMSVSARYIGSSSGRCFADHLEVPLDRLPVPARDRPGQLEVVLHRPAHEGKERLGRCVGLLEQLGRGPVERHEKALGHDSARVVDEALFVVQLEGAKTEQPGEPEHGVQRRLVLAGHGRPRAVELLGPAVPDEGLQRMQAEAADVRVECVERARAARVRDPGAYRDRLRNLGNSPIGHAENERGRRPRSPAPDRSGAWAATRRVAPQSRCRLGRRRPHRLR